MSELTVPDELFDADFVASDEHRLADRFDWIIQDGQIVHAPVVGWTWACPKCGESGNLPEEPVALFDSASPHGEQHAAGPFDTLVTLLVSVVREFPGSAPGAH
ncbi:hypothetical protein QF035_008983 [Streptomyces umbrinus]|uniref:Uncharacterized protein n=1 Tax=Streptomyces umbrinus TaxID=67370 RepID=A0ABU0T6I7_9ACTN|nr:hypothetical protein [Streptomyces umbrinus]MDQ1031401.1 hypothetical protein [Streptomyces umbrinus]